MPSPSPLAVASGSVVRLLKEEVSYRMELVDQEARVQALEKELARGQGQSSEDGNEEFMLKQQVKSPSPKSQVEANLLGFSPHHGFPERAPLFSPTKANWPSPNPLASQRTATEQTRAIFGPLRERIAIAITKLEEQITTGEASGAEAADLEQAKAVLAQAKAAQNGAS